MSTARQAESGPVSDCYHVFARNEDDIQESLALRRRVLVEAIGANARPGPTGLEADHLDAFCLHLIVRDVRRHHVVASARVLTHDAAIEAGGFDSAAAFDIGRLLDCPGRFLELSHICVDPSHAGGAAIAALWNGVVDLIRADDYDHLIGRVGIDLRGGANRAHAICHELLRRRPAPASRRVTPRCPLPGDRQQPRRAVKLPPLIRAYLRLGARIGGPPGFDRQNSAAEVFMYLNLARSAPLHARSSSASGAPAAHRPVRISA